MEIKLHLEKMTGHEIAEWLGISYDRYRRTRLKQLEKLEGYCDFDIIRGGIIVKEIYTDTYYGKLDIDLSNYILEEIAGKARRNEDVLSSAAGIVRKLIATEEKYKDINYNTLYYKVNKTLIALFGRTNINVEEQGVEYKGTCGWREKVWCIKVSNLNVYRDFAPDEEEIFDNIIEKYYSLPAKKTKMIALLDNSLKKEEITAAEYCELKEEIMGNFYQKVIEPFLQQTGLLVVQAQNHEVLPYYIGGAWENPKTLLRRAPNLDMTN